MTASLLLQALMYLIAPTKMRIRELSARQRPFYERPRMQDMDYIESGYFLHPDLHGNLNGAAAEVEFWMW